MKTKFLSNKIIISVFVAAICAAGFLSLPVFAQVAAAPLVVEFENAPPLPLFNQANFLPGQTTTRWVKVTNNSGQTQKIAVEAINAATTGDLASQLDLTIKEGATVLYNKTLKQFFDDGETFLSNLAGNGTQTQYDFSIAFKSDANDDFQGKSAGFDLLVGFQGQEGGFVSGGGGGGGVVLPPGLTILNEDFLDIQDTSITITWFTSYHSTSQVVYAAENEQHDLDLSDNAGTPPKYGYAHTTPEYDTSTKVVSHSVTISGLSPGTKYYYRAISHGSLAISQEHSFITKEAGEAEPSIRPEEKTSTGINNIEGDNISQGIGGELSTGGAISAREEAGQGLLAEGPQPQEASQQSEPSNGNPLKNLFTASIGLFPSDLTVLTLLAFIIILCIIIIFLLKQRKRERRDSSRHL